MLTQEEFALYLLQRGLVTPAVIGAGDLEVQDASRRHRSFKVISERGPSYLLKQGVDAERTAALAHEAAVYRLLQPDTGDIGLEARPERRGTGQAGEPKPPPDSPVSPLRTYLPRCYGYDSDEHLLVLELLPGAESLHEYHARRGRCPTRLAAQIGRALGLLHRLPEQVTQQVAASPGFASRTPGVLSINRADPGHLRHASSGMIELITIIQQFPALCELLAALRGEWRTEALIHFDFKWDNCLVFASPPSRRKTRLCLIDWELARLGDPCWDAGSVFHDYLHCWLLSIPITSEAPPDRFMELARYPLASVQPAMQVFWRTYTQQMGLGEEAAEARLLRAVRHGAARLVQTALETMQTAAEVTGNILLLLQLSLSMLQRPQEAAANLLGIPGDDPIMAAVP
jgi:aminoglycoside phosphotransferase (APT) family kinase protein